MTKVGFEFDEKACIGCNACQMACKDKNHVEMGFYHRRVETIPVETSEGKKWMHLSLSCQHCEQPKCVAACKMGAMYIREEGTVQVEPSKCIGCGMCAKACEYGAIFINQDNKASKCDACFAERAQGKEPACVAACITHCLTFSTNPSLSEARFRINQACFSPKRVSALQKKETIKSPVPERRTVEQLEHYVTFFSENPEKDLVYDYLFRGTDAFFTAPLWASTSGGEQILLNEVTQKVISFYHKYGYEPVWLEGNPPDYIGEQLRFLSYLWRSAKGDTSLEEKATKTFQECYVLPTMNALIQAVEGYLLKQDEQELQNRVRYYLKLLEEIRTFLSGDLLFPCEESQKIQRNQPVKDEEPHVIATGGINNCGGICVIRPTVQDGCLLRIESDCNPSHSPQIRACVRGRGYRKTFLNPARLKYPMKRVGKRGSGKFERISWEEAVSILSEEWKRIRNAYGPASRYVLYGTGVEGIMRPGKQIQRLLSLDGGYLDFFNSYSSACVNYVSNYIWGTSMTGNSASDLLHTKLLILWAENSAESIFGPERNYYLSLLKKQGVKIIAIDPRLSQTAVTYADEWLAIKPSTDAALADAMAYVIWSEGLQNQKFMDTYCIGFDEEHMPEGVDPKLCYRQYLFGLSDGVEKTPEWAEKITGIEAEKIRSLARVYATTKPACILTGLGAQRHGNGEQSARGISMLACLTGNVGVKGGGAGGNSSIFSEHACIENVLGTVENPYPGRIPTFLWTKAVEDGIHMTAKKDRVKGVEQLESNIKMIFCMASDILINQHGNINDTIRILQDESKCELIVCSDIFMTPSARYADLILPATSVLEGENLTPSWAGGNYFVKNNQVIRPLFGCQFEWEWIKELAEKLGYYEAFVDGRPDVSQWLRDNYEILRTKEEELPDYDRMSQLGGWQFETPVNYVAFEKEINDPIHYPFQTPSGKIEIFSKELYEMGQGDIPGIPKYIEAPEGPEDEKKREYPLQLIGWHTRRRCHSIHDNNEWMDEIEKPGVWIHPEDAKKREIQDGEIVLVYNDRGATRIPAIVTSRIREGVAAISQGGWYSPDKNGVDTRGCINILTSSLPTPLAKGNPQHTNLVEVKKWVDESKNEINR